MAERGKERKEWIRKRSKRRAQVRIASSSARGARSLAGPGPGILSAAWGRRAEQGLLLDPSARLDRIR